MHKYVWIDKLGNHVIVGDARLVEQKRREIEAKQKR